ncbi:MAG TPA: efflux RND transporter periplasmic adaptor subunit [Bryobacteraceae bacterium]|nr:efflux RND transporter periplasmic adaptor subunit [Bryobacteraceae bacterium]
MTDQPVITTRPLHKFGIPGVLLVAATLAGCTSNAQQQTQGQAPPAPTVQVTAVAPQDTPIFSEYPAQTYARDLVEVRARVDGYIERWLFKPGQQVTAGQPLYILDLRPYRAQLQQAQGSVKQAEADLTFAKQQVSVLEAQANLEAANANLIKAQQDYNRFKPLVEQDAAARQDLDAATAQLRAAESAVRARQATLDQTRLTTDTQVQAAEGRLQQQRGSLSTATLNVQYGTVISPVAGRIGDTLAPVGGLVTANSAQPLTTVTPLDPIWVRFKINESQYLEYERLRRTAKGTGPPLELLLADDTKFSHAGRIENTLNQVDPRTGTLEVQARFPNPQKAVLPGQFGRVRFQTRDRQGVILVPQRAVQQNQSIQAVYVVAANNTIEARPVKTAERVGNNWIIEQGLRPGDRVVVEGILSVRPGVAVRAIPYRGEQTK